MATALTRGGAEWTPLYLDAIDYELCIGCGRCYKVCGRGVLEPIEKPFEDEEDEFGDDMGNMVMSVSDKDPCIGCTACAQVCARNAHTHIEV
jgi:Nif-specific ferredoxin III